VEMEGGEVVSIILHELSKDMGLFED